MGQAMTVQKAFDQSETNVVLGELPQAQLAMPKQLLEGPSLLRAMRRRLYRWLAPESTARIGLGR